MDWRARSAVSLVQLAEAAGFRQSWVSNVEHGRRNPSWANVVRLAEGRGVPLGEPVEVAESLVEQYGSGPYEALDFTRSR
jgi:transcriptional regulator with XRE-family HTH domain